MKDQLACAWLILCLSALPYVLSADDMWYIILCSFIITIVERANLENDEEQ